MKVSVILSSYNHKEYIAESISSVLNQTFQDFELIIIDDCSADDSRSVIDSFDDSRIVRIYHDYNHGVGIIKEGIFSYAKGEYIAIHHSDDVWELDKLEKQVQFLDQNTNYAGVFSDAEAITEDGEIYQDENGFYYNVFQTQNRNRFQWLNRFFYEGNCLCHPSLLMRHKVYDEIQPFTNGLRQIPDMVMWIKICMKYDIYVMPEKLVRFRVHKNGKNTSGFRADTQIRSTIELHIMLKNYLSIENKEDFLEIFPDAKEFVKGEIFIIEYSLAKICLSEGMQGYTRLFGLNLLYDLINDAEKADILKRQYNYTHKEFVSDTGKMDIFHVLPEALNQRATVMFDAGDGWDLENKIEYKYDLKDVYEFAWTFPLGDKPINKLRFDPAEGIFVSCNLKKIVLNGEKVEFMPLSRNTTDGDTVCFWDLDPIYTTNDCTFSGGELTICGEIKRLNEDDVISNLDYVIKKAESLEEKNVFLEKDYQQAKELFYNEQKKNEQVILGEQRAREAFEKKIIGLQEEQEKLVINYQVEKDDYIRQMKIQKEKDLKNEKEIDELRKLKELNEKNLYAFQKENETLFSEITRIKEHWVYKILLKKVFEKNKGGV